MIGRCHPEGGTVYFFREGESGERKVFPFESLYLEKKEGIVTKKRDPTCEGGRRPS